MKKCIHTDNNNKKLKKLKMAKRVLRYTEEEFVTLLENIVNKVKSEEKINESREVRKKSLNERFKKLK